MRSFALLILALAMACTAFSQGNFKPAYVIKNNGDTVRGYIEEGNESKISSTVSFKKSITEASAQNFTVMDITAFGFDGGNTFRKTEYNDAENNKAVNFAKHLVKGYYSLYGFLQKDRRFFIIKNQQDSTYLLYDDEYSSSGSYVQTGNFKNVLIFICGSNCDKLKNEASQEGYTETALIDFVKRVNSCIAPSAQSEILYKAPKTVTQIYAYAGGMAFGNKHELAGSIVARFTLPSVDRKTSLNVGINFMQHFEDKDVYIPYAGNYTGMLTNEKITTNFVSITSTFNYYFTNGKLRPYFNAGLSYSFRHQSGELNSYRQPTTFKDNGITYVVAGGIDFNVTPMLFIRAEWRQESILHQPTIGIAYFLK